MRACSSSTPLTPIESHEYAEKLGVLCDIDRRIDNVAGGKVDCDLAEKAAEKALQNDASPLSVSRLAAVKNAVGAMDLARGDGQAAFALFKKNREMLEKVPGLRRVTYHDTALVDALMGAARAELALNCRS